MYMRTCALSEDSDQTVRTESSLGAFWIAKDAKFLHADNQYSGQTARMRRVSWVYVGRKCQKVLFHIKTQLFFEYMGKYIYIYVFPQRFQL